MELGAIDAPTRVELEADVIIIGTGAGGAVMAAELTALGLSVLMIEEGDHHKTESFNAEPTPSIRRLYRDAGMTVMLGKPSVGYAEGRCVGGSTVINGGMSWRTPERILRDWEAQGLPDIGPEAMAPRFEKVEAKIHVAHQSPESIGRDATLFAQGARALGYRVVDNLRNQHSCLGSNNCMFGCPNRAKRSTLVTYVPEAMAGGASLVHGCRIERVVMSGGRAVGVVGRFVNPKARGIGKSFYARGRAVIVSCGAAQTPALLWRSGLNSPRLGRDLWVHPNAKCVGLFPDPVVGWHGVHQAYQIREFEEEGLVFGTANIPPGLVALSLPRYGAGLPELMDRYDDMLVSGVLVEDSHPGRVRLGAKGQPMLFYDTTRQDMDQFIRGVAIQADVFFAAGADTVLTPFHDLPILKTRADVQALRRARLGREHLELFTVHLMGTARMGISPETSVTDPTGRVHGTENLYVADASIFPGPIGVNPMETIMALSTRNAPAVAASLASQGRAQAEGWAPASPAPATWAALCEAPTPWLERWLRSGRAPAAEGLAGWEFHGWRRARGFGLLGARQLMLAFDDEDVAGAEVELRGDFYAVSQTGDPAAPWRARPSHDAPRAEGSFVARKVDLKARPFATYPDAWRIASRQLGASGSWRCHLAQPFPDRPEWLIGKVSYELGPAVTGGGWLLLERARRRARS